MPRLIFTVGAQLGLDRCRRLLDEQGLRTAQAAGHAIASVLPLLREAPLMGRPWPGSTVLYELLIEFERSGFVALYHYQPPVDDIHVLAFRYQREAGHDVRDFAIPSDRSR